MIPMTLGTILKKTKITAIRASTTTLQVLAPHQCTNRHHQDDENEHCECDEEELHGKVSRGVREGRKTGGFDLPKIGPLPDN